jgi:protease-4
MILLFSGTESSYGANVAVIPVEGVIMASGDASGFGSSGVVTSDDLIEKIQEAEDDAAIKAVVFRINSPGGTAVGSDEIATAIKGMKKPSVAVIREVGASGAYWVASSTDHVVANRMSITGSIGVISSYLSFGRFLEHYNVTYNQLTAGERKDVGTPLRELEPSERDFLQEKLDAIHHYFIFAVAENRNMTYDDVKALATGEFYLGFEAKENGLVDELGGEQQALDWINATLQIEPVTVVYEDEPSLLDLLAGVTSGTTRLTPEKALREAALQDEGVPMAR